MACEGRLRFAYRGTTLRNGRLVELKLPKGATEVPGKLVLCALKEECAVDLERFAPSFYDKSGEGWRPLRADSTLPASLLVQPSRLEIMLDDRSLMAGQIVRAAQSVAADDIDLGDGFFGIGIWRGKSEANHGTLWRSAFQLGAAFTFTVGARFNKSATRSTDTVKCWTKIPAFHYDTFEQFVSCSPYSAPRVAVEFNDSAIPLTHFDHPPRAVYILGSEDSGLPAALKKACTHVVSIPTAARRVSL